MKLLRWYGFLVMFFRNRMLGEGMFVFGVLSLVVSRLRLLFVKCFLV